MMGHHNASQFFSKIASQFSRNLLAPGQSVASLLCPFSLKSAVKADFLTLKPIYFSLSFNLGLL